MIRNYIKTNIEIVSAVQWDVNGSTCPDIEYLTGKPMIVCKSEDIGLDLDTDNYNYLIIYPDGACELYVATSYGLFRLPEGDYLMLVSKEGGQRICTTCNKDTFEKLYKTI